MAGSAPGAGSGLPTAFGAKYLLALGIWELALGAGESAGARLAGNSLPW
jgi:hypothetical protein